jgi:1,2-diacylglycerol-3-alpha-glucose alpha-1,2-glucosyltransferase
MKILLYTEGLKTIGKSGLGKAVGHQIKALEDNNIEYTLDPKCNDYDIAHINFYGLKSFHLAKKAHRMGKKVVYHAHSTEEDFRNSFIFSNTIAPLFKWWICKCYRLGDHIITPTEYSKKLLENYNLNRPITAISNGIDMKFFNYNKKDGEDFRKKYGFTSDDKVVIGIGLYLERKGILTFVEMAKRCPEYKFIWFGSSPLSVSPKKIKDAVHTKLDNLIFAGYVEREMIHKAFSGCDCYLFPTLEETEGIPILEGLSEKANIVVRNIPIFEFLEDGKDVYKAKTDDEFEEKLRGVIEGSLPSLKGNGYELVKNMEIKTVGKKIIKVYEDVLKF